MNEDTDRPPPSAASTSTPTASSSPSGWRPPPAPPSPAQVELALLDAAAKASRTSYATKPRPARAAFDRVMALAGGDLWAAVQLAKAEARAAGDDGRRRRDEVVPLFCESADEAAARAEAQRAARRQQLVAASGVPSEYRGARLADASRVPAEDRAAWLEVAGSLRAAASRPRAVIGLCGGRGPGKTHLSCALVLDECEQLRPARWLKVRDYFSAITREWRPRGDVDRVERAMREPRLLVLDELQDRSHHESLAHHLTALIDDRYSDGKVTVLVANLTTKELQISVGESVEDRMHEAGGILECDWPSLRGRLLKLPERSDSRS